MPLERGVRRSSGDLVLQKFWERASAARAGDWTLERGSVSDARAWVWPLERGDWVKAPCFDFLKSLFHISSLSYFSKNTIVELLTLELYILSRY